MDVWMQDRTWPEIEAYLVERQTVLLPVGSTEQHGPHLPLGTDTIEAISVAEGVAERLDLLVAPPLWFGDARSHLAYPGTVALRPETMLDVLKDIYDSLAFHGFERVITVNGHRRANVPAIKLAAKQAKETNPEVEYVLADLVQIAVSDHEELMDGSPEDGTHAGEFETSFVMTEKPDLVREEEFEPQVGKPVSDRVTRSALDKQDTLQTASSWQENAAKREESHPGHRGDPTQASAEKGAELREAMIESVVEFVEDIQTR